jgi:hypothetical protein
MVATTGGLSRLYKKLVSHGCPLQRNNLTGKRFCVTGGPAVTPSPDFGASTSTHKYKQIVTYLID